MKPLRAPLLALSLVAAVPCASRGSADEPRPEARARVAITAARETVYVGEPITLRLELGLDDAWFQAHAVPLVRQAMDLPVLVLAPAMDALPGTIRRPPQPAPDVGPAPRRFVLNDGPALAAPAPPLERDGHPFSAYRVEVELLPTQPGVLVVPPPTLRFAYATRFERDFAGGRLPLDRTDVRVAGTAPSIRVLPLPEEGRPEGFTGAVGRFTMQAALDPSSPAGGKGVRLVLRIEGAGNLEAFDTPSLAGLDGFHVYGALDDRGRPVRTIRYDLGPVRDGVREVPPIALATFDPTPPAGYRTVTTATVPLATPLTPRGGAGREGTMNEGAGETQGKGRGWGGARGGEVVVAIAVAILAALGYGLSRGRRARAAAAADPAHGRMRAALEALRATTGRPDADPAGAFAEVLAARLACPAAAVIASDLAARLAAAGVEPDMAAQAAVTLERLVGARYGGGAAIDAPRDLVALAERIAARAGAHGATARGR